MKNNWFSRQVGEQAAAPNAVAISSARQVFLEMYFLAVAALAVSAYMKDSTVMTAIIFANIALRFLLIGRRHDWMFFLFGLVAGGANDAISMAKGVYFYTVTDLLPIPIPVWMLFFWGHIFVAFRQLFLAPVFRDPPPAGRPWRLDRRLAADFITYALLRAAVYTLVRREPELTIVYAAILAVRLLVVLPTARELLLIAVTVSMGVAFEAVLIACGLYVYYNPVFLGMPAWLLMYWVFAIPLFAKGLFSRMEASLGAGRKAA